MQDEKVKRERTITEHSFHSLLQALADDPAQTGERYEHLRRSLIKYFDWRGSLFPDRDTDETIDRLSRKLADGPTLDDLFTYALGIARNVLLESLRSQEREREAIQNSEILMHDSTREESDLRFRCFETCLEELPAAKKGLIVAYYDGDKQRKIANRKRLAEEAGMPISRLRIQAHRIRQTLEDCIEECLSSTGDGTEFKR